jgi:hypothetical protein
MCPLITPFPNLERARIMPPSLENAKPQAKTEDIPQLREMLPQKVILQGYG